MNKAPANNSTAYVDPFLFEVGFFKDRSERDKLVEGVRKLNQRIEQRPNSVKKNFLPQ